MIAATLLSFAQAATTEWPLPSGLAILHRPDARFPIVRVVVVVGAGTADTAPGQRPLAHLAEHMALRADPAGGPAWQTLRAAGCAVNGVTRLDTTSFFMECPTDAAALAVGFAAALATHDLGGLDEDTVTTEARVVLAETTQRRDAGVQVDLDMVRTVFAGEHPYHREERVPEDLLALRLADVEGFFRAHYVPANVVIAVGGDLDATGLARLLTASAPDGFADPRQRRGEVTDWPAGSIGVQWLSALDAPWFRDPERPEQPLGPGRSLPPAAQKAPVPPVPDPGPHAASTSGTWPMVQVAWYLPPADRDNWVHLEMAETFAVVTLRPLLDDDDVVDADCTVFPGTRGSALVCGARVESEERMVPIGRRIAGAFRGDVRPPLERRLLGADDLGDLAWSAVVRRDRQGVGDLENVSVYRLATGRFDIETQVRTTLGGGQGVSAWLALRAAWLGPERAVTTLVEPEARSPLGGEESLYGVGGEPRALHTAAPALGLVALHGAQEGTLENGLRTIVMPVPGPEIAAWRLAVPSLPGLEYLEEVIDASLRKPERYQGNKLRYRWRITGESDGTVVESNQRGDWDPRQLLRSLWGLVEARDSASMARAFRRTVREEIYAGRSPYTWLKRASRRALREDADRDGLPEIDEALRKPRAVEAYLRARYQPGRSTLLVAGVVDSHAPARIVEEMGDWSASTATPPPLRTAQRRAPRPEVIVLDGTGASQTVTVTWMCPTAGETPDPLIAALLRRLAADRLFDAVRTERGLTYSPGASTYRRWGGVDLQLGAATELGNEAEVLAMLRAIAGDLGQGRGVERWLPAARREVMSDELRRGASTLGLAEVLSDAALRPGGLSALHASRAALAAVDARAVARLLGTCSTVGVAVLVGPAGEIARHLEGGDLPVRILDWRAEHLALVKRWLPAQQSIEKQWLDRADKGDVHEF